MAVGWLLSHAILRNSYGVEEKENLNASTALVVGILEWRSSSNSSGEIYSQWRNLWRFSGLENDQPSFLRIAHNGRERKKTMCKRRGSVMLKSETECLALPSLPSLPFLPFLPCLALLCAQMWRGGLLTLKQSSIQLRSFCFRPFPSRFHAKITAKIG